MSTKRKSTALGIERRVRARREEDWEPEASADPSASEASADEEASEDADDTGSDNDSDAASDQDDGSAYDGPLASISFGALARAQESLPASQRRRKASQASDPDGPPEHSHKRPERGAKDGSSSTAEKRKQQQQQQDLKRSSKHAPQEVSSKKPVSRRREIIADTRRKARDPRFDALAGRVDEARIAKAYSFLDEYRESEMAELRAQIKKTKGAEEKEALKRQLLSMESKKKARLKREEEARVLDEHRRREKELVAQGKKPFYLKESERKKQLLVKRFEGMSKGQVDRAIERKRKKVASKEKKELISLERRRH
ncbi:rRNA biogenesis protein RRP36 [Escovopsis weberi]|uniref:rRNA biogenesis protein RRP36 n=1 Tax=Escovopsis weberi TaxID=150374 RepID=A0A0M9VTP8_ESCWE|nr:rRNA biogenesis protein RRP36 [Escovopsis weberi]